MKRYIKIILSITICEGNNYCNVCRDAPINSSRKRYMGRPKKKFTQSNGVTMTCGELEESVADVRVGMWAASGENYICATAQYIAWLNCDCRGVSIPDPDETYKDPNPACNLCGHNSLQYDSVPQPNKEKLTTTQFGKMNCEGLYIALAEGIVSAYMCPQITMTSGPECCNLPDIESGKYRKLYT